MSEPTCWVTMSVQGVKHQLDIFDLDGNEAHKIKQIAGLSPAQYEDAIGKFDVDFFIALSHIAISRKGFLRPTLDELYAMKLGQITPSRVDTKPEEEEGEDGPPADAGPEANGGSATTPPVSGTRPSEPSSD